MTKVEIYSEKIEQIWGNTFNLLEYLPGNKKLKIKTRLIIQDLNGLRYNVCPYHFINQKKQPEASTCLDKTDWFINKANNVHQSEYNYNYSEYKDSHTKLTISCDIHGNFSITPNNHLSGEGCPKCSREILNLRNTKSLTKFIEESLIIHNNNYDYSKFNYINCHTKGLIICKIHGDFEQTPTNHKTSGCPKCGDLKLKGGYAAISKYQPETEVYIYIIKLTSNDESFFKVGLAKNIKNRLNKIPYKKDILYQCLGKVKDLFKLEQEIINRFMNNKYSPSIKFSGKHECFKISDKELKNYIKTI